MALDPSIALGVKPIEIANPLAQYGQIAQLQAAQNQNSLAQYQLGAAQRAEAKDVARTNMLSQAGTDDTAIANALLKSGDLKGYSDFVKTRRETIKADTELVDAKLKQSRQFLDTINPADPNAPAQYLAWHQANHKDPVLGPTLAARGVTADQSMARIQQAIKAGPQAFAELLNQSKLGTEKFMELNKPQYITQDLGGSSRVSALPGLGGAPTTLSDTKKTMTFADTIAQGRLGVEQQRVGLEGERVQIARDEAKRKELGLEALPPKEIQKREAAYPQATSSIKGFETKSDDFIKDLEKLRDDPGLNLITGSVYGRTPSLSREGSRAQATYNKIFAKGGFQALQDMRDASKTGGALGNVSNQEGERLERSVVGGLDRTQNVEDVKKGIDDLIDQIKGSKVRMREAYDMTYDYKRAKPAAGGGWKDL